MSKSAVCAAFLIKCREKIFVKHEKYYDKRHVHILTNCRRAIAPGGRLLLVERRLVPEEPASPMAFLDLMMLVVGGGTGRSEAEYRRLLAEACFELIQVVSTKTDVSIFEARPV